ncbi:hypothetical protein GGX14DRAFT_582527 [Mycena pura]|uniref:Uncharacterized protein n=1 Tax=Mycena pura TaxID=153505 RepID=A0AAD7E5Q4_9AGAR|nr:hypothetical protein GGX14DRAFT_582527 [Mycena pura]
MHRIQESSGSFRKSLVSLTSYHVAPGVTRNSSDLISPTNSFVMMRARPVTGFRAASVAARFQLRRAPVRLTGFAAPSFNFSTCRPLRLEKHLPPGPQLDPSGTTPPPLPKKLDRWEELGISKNMKIVLIVILTILGTVETFVWAKGILGWYYGAPKEDEYASIEAVK